MFTAHQAKYFAHELTKRSASNSIEKFAGTLLDAQVDLNPHQVDAALFAFRSPLSKGALLADEVGLGKTIEAGIVIAQKWAERKRKIMIIAPANLRKQWSQELADKFFLQSTILETKSFNAEIKKLNLNPFIKENIVICSYQFARSKAAYIEAIAWDLTVIDEAHRLRNVYKIDNKIGKAIKSALAKAPKILLTATPLQNNINELYGLVSIIDEQVFGDLNSFKAQFGRLNGAAGDTAFAELRQRIQPVCKRTLRRQVLEYIKYTNRIALVEEFYPSAVEMELYDLVSDYLMRPDLIALPSGQRQLMTMILRKLLASSTYAISGTFAALANRLEEELKQLGNVETVEAVTMDYELYDELVDEYTDEDDAEKPSRVSMFPKEAVLAEIEELRSFQKLAEAIEHNSKGLKLLTALERGFYETDIRGAARKAIIFTESVRTQKYIQQILNENGFTGKIVLFNGSNNDTESNEIYRNWQNKNKDTDKISGSMTADKRAALVEYFRDEAEIMIATEAAAEGINLQFCSLVINYDLPWNPQRIEQRIGRCHRYGQKHDVVVVNFLNKTNAADQRVYELLNEKFKLFSGVFGASDEVLGSIESGVDFEKRIAAIYQNCRHPEEIQRAFDELQKELEEKIDESLKNTRQMLLENFDEEVHEKLRLSRIEGNACLDKYEQFLWKLAKYYLKDEAVFNDTLKTFSLLKTPGWLSDIDTGIYSLTRHQTDCHIFRTGSPLAQAIIRQATAEITDNAVVEFDYSNYPAKISVIENLRGLSGQLVAWKITADALETEDHIIIAAITDSGETIDEDICRQLMKMPARVVENQIDINESAQDVLYQSNKERLVAEIAQRNLEYFDIEISKLDKWADDVKSSLEIELRQQDIEIKVRRTEAAKILVLKDKLVARKTIAELEKRRNELRNNLYLEQDKVEHEKIVMIDAIAMRLDNKIEEEKLFSIRWQII